MTMYSNVRVGDVAPAFTLPDDTGNYITLASLRGQRVVLYFYPKDDTSGCTIEACEFRDLLPRFQSSNALVYGVSPDTVATHQKFKAKYNLTFPLLSDATHLVSETYGTWREKSMYGNKYMGMMRTTYVISPEGIVEQVWEKVAHEGHAAEVEAFLRGEAPPAPVAKPAVATKPAKKPVKKAAKKAVKRAAKKDAKKVAKKPVKKAAKKAAKKAVKKATKKAVKKVAKKPAKKPASRPTRAAKKK
jgi:thioredoxin-dependent peroxiredoxin